LNSKDIHVQTNAGPHDIEMEIEEFIDTKGVIRIRISKENRQPKGQKKKDKRTNNDLQNITHKTKDRVTPLKTGCELRYSEG